MELPIQFALWGKARIGQGWTTPIVRLQEDPQSLMTPHDVLITDSPELADHSDPIILRSTSTSSVCGASERSVRLPTPLDYLASGDVLKVDPQAQQVSVLYRKRSSHNSLLITEQCSSFCVMCSQPPRLHDDSYLVNDLLSAIPLMDTETAVLGITGGEPTLRFARFLDVLRSIRANLPETGVHVLSNGRLFSYTRYAQAVAEIGLSDMQFGVPLYSDLPHRHDQVVQARGAFEQTVRGLLNLARVGVSVEIRVVIHRYTIDRLTSLARFIARNLPFVDHVALMGLEPMGFGKSNLDALWVDPLDYASQLEEATTLLNDAGLCVSIYNHQLCTLNEHLWDFVVPSISDWKRHYPPTCDSCGARERCGGFFASSVRRMSRGITPIPHPNPCGS